MLRAVGLRGPDSDTTTTTDNLSTVARREEEDARQATEQILGASSLFYTVLLPLTGARNPLGASDHAYMRWLGRAWVVGCMVGNQSLQCALLFVLRFAMRV